MHPALPALLMACLDGLGTFVFALSGAVLAIRKGFDLFGILFLSWIVGVAGGITRDVLIGAVPPATIANWHDFAIAIGAGLLTFFVFPIEQKLNNPVQVLDAIGLGVFAVTGAQKAISYGINPVIAPVLGMISGIGGGMTRDILAGDIPFVLRKDIYAIAALAAGVIVTVGSELGFAPLWPMLLGLAVCIFLRTMAIFFGWRVPASRWGRGKDRGIDL